MRQTNRVFIAAIVLALGAGGYFVWHNQVLSAQLNRAMEQVAELKEAKSEVETELAVLRASDFIKEIELLQLKLKTAEQNLVAKERGLATALQEKSGLANQLQAARANSAKIRARLDAVDVVERMVGAGPNAESVANVDSKIAMVKEAGVTEVWAIAKRDIDFARMSWNGNTIADVVMALTRSIRNLLP